MVVLHREGLGSKPKTAPELLGAVFIVGVADGPRAVSVTDSRFPQ